MEVVAELCNDPYISFYPLVQQKFVIWTIYFRNLSGANIASGLGQQFIKELNHQGTSLSFNASCFLCSSLYRTPLPSLEKKNKNKTRHCILLKRFNSENLCACAGLFSAKYWYTTGTLVGICASEAVNMALGRPCLSKWRNIMNF